MTQLMEEKRTHLSNFERFEKESNGDAPWLDELRKAGMARFGLVGFPDDQDENWRFTNLKPITGTKFTLAANEITDAVVDRATEYGFGADAITELIFVNG